MDMMIDYIAENYFDDFMDRLGIELSELELPNIIKPEIEMPGNNGADGVTGGSQSAPSTYAKKVAEITNDERNEAGLESLAFSRELSDVAQKKAEDMRDNGYFSHTSPTYGTPFEMMTEFDIVYGAAGENIAKGQRTPENVMKAWMNSAGHRDNILGISYRKIGVGYCTDTSGNTYWVQMFTD